MSFELGHPILYDARTKLPYDGYNTLLENVERSSNSYHTPLLRTAEQSVALPSYVEGQLGHVLLAHLHVSRYGDLQFLASGMPSSPAVPAWRNS